MKNIIYTILITQTCLAGSIVVNPKDTSGIESDVSTLQSQMTTAQNDIIAVEDRASDTEASLLQTDILAAFNHDMDDLPTTDGRIINFNDLTGVNQGSSTNITNDASGDFVTNTLYVAASSVDAGVWLKLNDNAASSSVVNDGTSSLTFTAKDNSGSSVNTSTMSTNGKVNTALTVVSGENYVTAGYDAAIDTTTGSISFWVKLSSTSPSDQYAMSFTTSETSAGTFMSIRVDPDLIYVGGSIGECFWTDATLADLAWHHIVFTQDATSGEPKLYLDSVDQGAASADSLNNNWIAASSYGTIQVLAHLRGNGVQMNGALDDVRIYPSVVLSQAQVDTIYNSGSGTEDALSTPASGGTMSLVTSNFLFDTGYDFAAVRLLWEEGTNATLNTNLKFYLSNDGGTTSNQVTLTDSGAYKTGSPIKWLTGTNQFADVGTSNFVGTLSSEQGAGKFYSTGFTLN